MQEEPLNGIHQLTKPMVKDLLFPVPCPEIPKKSLEIQAEIVRILNTFSELTARKKQYEYYPEQLLSFEEGEVQHLSMGNESIGKFIRGGGLQKKGFY